MVYKVSVEYKNLWKDGRRIKSPKFKKETTCWSRRKNKGVLRGAESYKQHLVDVYGKENVRNFKIKKVGKC